MQMSFQLLNGAPRPSRACAAASLIMLGFMAELRAEPASDWIAGPKSAARLIAAPAPAAGPYKAGVELRLEGGAHTYWRTPGEAGVPPVFDFAGSENVKNAVVSYPAPTRIDEAGLDLFGYRGDVIFPVDVELADDSRPAVLALSLDYAVCGAICLPVKAKVTLALPARPAGAAAAAASSLPRGGRPASRQRKGAAASRRRGARRPIRHHAGRRRRSADLARAGQDRAGYGRGARAGRGRPVRRVPARVVLRIKRTADPDEFLIVEVEAPPPEVAAAASGGSQFGDEAAAGKIPVTITLAQPRQSYEFALDLGAVSGRPLAHAAVQGSAQGLATPPDGGRQ